MGLYGSHARWADLGDHRICRQSADARQPILAGSVPDVCIFLDSHRATPSFLPCMTDPGFRYIVTLTMAPAFFAAAIYLCLGRIIVVYGEHVSRFRPRTYTFTFIACDVLSLVFQAVGGALASAANNQKDLQTGVDVMLAGLGLQVASLTLFIVLAAEFAWRAFQSKHDLNPTHAALRESKLFKFFLFGKRSPTDSLTTGTMADIIIFRTWCRNGHNFHPLHLPCRRAVRRFPGKACQR